MWVDIHPEVNKELFLRVKEHILEEPLRVHMGYWKIGIESGNRITAWPKCNTVGCIMGWGQILTGASPIRDSYDIKAHISQGMELFGIKMNQAEKLFMVTDWPREYKERIEVEDNQTKEYAQVVADRIDYFLETGE